MFLRRLATSAAALSHSFSSLRYPPFTPVEHSSLTPVEHSSLTPVVHSSLTPVVHSSLPSSKAQMEELNEKFFQLLKSIKLLGHRTGHRRTTQQEFEYNIMHSTAPSIAYECRSYFHRVAQKEPGFAFSVTLFTVFLNQLARGGKYNYIFQIFRYSISAVRLNLVNYNHLLFWIGKASMHDPLAVLGRILVIGYVPNYETYINLIESLIRLNRIDAAYFFMQMKKYKCLSHCMDRDLFSERCESLIARLSNEGRTSCAVWIMEQMKITNLKVDVAIYELIIEGFCKEGKTNTAMAVFSEVKSQGVRPRRSAYLSLERHLRLVGWNREAIRLRKEMMDQPIQPTRPVDPIVFYTLKRAIRELGKKKFEK